jgi:hypothetical protein
VSKHFVERAHLADLLCRYLNHEILCAQVCGGPYSVGVTKLETDKHLLGRMMKDMLDALHTKFHDANLDGTGIYVLGIQV